MIRDKVSMYRALSRGDFGNTIPQFYSVESWLASDDCYRFALWGVRSSRVSSHTKTRMFVPRDEVADYANQHFADGVNISCMVDAVCEITAWLEVYESETGLVVQGIEHPPKGLSWREGMRNPALLKTWNGIAAKQILRKHLNANSLDDLDIVLSRYPGHVVEMSAVDRCVGTVPHRNAIVWEVRNY